jgi:hypothetical protein
MVEPERPQMAGNMQARCMLDYAGLVKLHARKQTSALVQPQTHTIALTRRHSPMRNTHTHTHRNMKYLLIFHSNNGYAKALQCYAVRTLPILFNIRFTE